ncbi:hypothetical protein E2542_SST24662 [Spatholobus suberectus]|nr:hypothetical protein E2542_SST24662 [Spatholobus suberectus]
MNGVRTTRLTSKHCPPSFPTQTLPRTRTNGKKEGETTLAVTSTTEMELRPLGIKYLHRGNLHTRLATQQSKLAQLLSKSLPPTQAAMKDCNWVEVSA